MLEYDIISVFPDIFLPVILQFFKGILIQSVKERNNPVTGFQRFSRSGGHAVVTDTVPEVQNLDLIRIIVPGETKICVISVYSDRSGIEIIAIAFIDVIDAEVLTIGQGEPEAVETIAHNAGIPVSQHVAGKTEREVVLLIVRERIDLCFHRHGIIEALL